MALYKDAAHLTHSIHEAFDKLHSPGASAPNPGIYRCEGCGHEETSAMGKTLPPQNHHQHTTAQGAIRWRLVVSHSSKPS